MATRARKSGSSVVVSAVKGTKAAPKGKPNVELKTGLTGGKKYFIKINQPGGKSVLVAVHL